MSTERPAFSDTLFIDLETGPLPLEELEAQMPTFEAPGNYKKPEAIAENIAEQKSKWIEKAALNPFSAQILCVGWMKASDMQFNYIDGNGSEAELLKHLALVTSNPAHRIVWFGGFGFDIKMAQQRAWKHGVTPIEDWTFDPFRQSRHLDIKSILEGRKPERMISLDQAGKHFLGRGKNGSGGDFAAKWAEDRPASLRYLENDVRLIAEIAKKMNVV
jgi:hypothetical protein